MSVQQTTKCLSKCCTGSTKSDNVVCYLLIWLSCLCVSVCAGVQRGGFKQIRGTKQQQRLEDEEEDDDSGPKNPLAGLFGGTKKVKVHPVCKIVCLYWQLCI